MSNAKNIASAIQKGSNVYVYDEKAYTFLTELENWSVLLQQPLPSKKAVP